VYTLAQNNKPFSIVCIFSTLLITFVCSTGDASLPNMPRYCERILRENKFSTDTPEQIMEATKSKSYFVRYIALQLLTHRIGEQAIPTLKEVLSDPHIRVRWTAAHLLGTLDDNSGLERMRMDFAEFVPRNGDPKPPDPNIARDPQAMNQWQKIRLYRIRRALEVAKVLAELTDRRGYELAVRAGLESPLAANRSRAVKVLAEIAKTDESVLAAEGKHPVFVLSAMAECEKRRTVFIQIVTSATRLGSNIGARILEKAKDNPYQSEREIGKVKRFLDGLKVKINATENKSKD